MVIWGVFHCYPFDHLRVSENAHRFSWRLCSNVHFWWAVRSSHLRTCATPMRAYRPKERLWAGTQVFLISKKDKVSTKRSITWSLAAQMVAARSTGVQHVHAAGRSAPHPNKYDSQSFNRRWGWTWDSEPLETLVRGKPYHLPTFLHSPRWSNSFSSALLTKKMACLTHQISSFHSFFLSPALFAFAWEPQTNIRIEGQMDKRNLKKQSKEDLFALEHSLKGLPRTPLNSRKPNETPPRKPAKHCLDLPSWNPSKQNLLNDLSHSKATPPKKKKKKNKDEVTSTFPFALAPWLHGHSEVCPNLLPARCCEKSHVGRAAGRSFTMGRWEA